MLKEFSRSDKRIFIKFLHHDKFLHDELIFILAIHGFLELNSHNFTRNKSLDPFSAIFSCLKQTTNKFQFTALKWGRKVILKVYLFLRANPLTGSLILTLKNFVIQRYSHQKTLGLSNETPAPNEEEFDPAKVPTIVLGSRIGLERVKSDAERNGLTTISLPNADMLFVHRQIDQIPTNSEDNAPYPIPYSYIRNSYYAEGSSSEKSAIVVIDCLDYFTEKSIYGRELMVTMKQLNIKRISLVYSSSSLTDIRGPIPVAAPISSRELNFSNFQYLREVFTEDAVVLRLSTLGMPWLENYTRVAKIPYIDVTSSLIKNEAGVELSDLTTLLGNIRKIPQIFDSNHESTSNSIQDVQLSETVWREKTYELISRISQ